MDAGDFAFLLLRNKSDLPEKTVQPPAAREYAEMKGRDRLSRCVSKDGRRRLDAIRIFPQEGTQEAPKEHIRLHPKVVDLENENKKQQSKWCHC
jgi:hypothetical protein